MVKLERRGLARVRGLAVMLVLCVLVGYLGLRGAEKARGEPLSDELARRSARESLGLVCVSASRVLVHPFGLRPMSIRNPRSSSWAWFSSNGRFVAWKLDPSYAKKLWGPTPLLIEAIDGSPSWQVAGTIFTSGPLAISEDGRRIVFAGVYLPPDVDQASITRVPDAAPRLYYADSHNPIAIPIRNLNDPLADMGSISWSPGGRAFVYDMAHRIYIYTFSTANRRYVAEGSAVAWSPDGTRLAFRSAQSTAVIMDLRTNQTNFPFNADPVAGVVHWSPDSRYVMVSQRRNALLDLLENPTEDRTYNMLICRLKDGERTSSYIDATGVSDKGFYWVDDYRAFLKWASAAPKIRRPVAEGLTATDGR